MKLQLSKNWFEKNIKREGDYEITAGPGVGLAQALKDGELHPLPGHGEVFVLQEFAQHVNQESLTDDDGFACWSNGTEYHPKDKFQPSQFWNIVRFGAKPGWATHVIWFNK